MIIWNYIGYAAAWSALVRILRGRTGWDKTARTVEGGPEQLAAPTSLARPLLAARTIEGISRDEVDRLCARAQEYVDQAFAEAQPDAVPTEEVHLAARRIADESHRRAMQLLEDAPLGEILPAPLVQELERDLESFSITNSDLSDEMKGLLSGVQPG